MTGGAGRRRGGFWRWQWEAFHDRLRDPRRDVRYATMPHDVAPGRAPWGELRVTWVGHATVLLQTGAANLLMDPVWSRRASPVQWAGPARHAPPGVPFSELPPIDAVLLSHDHYDHLDRVTIEALASRGTRVGTTRVGRDVAGKGSEIGPGGPPLFVTPRGYRGWMAARGVRRLRELNWWETAALAAGGVRITAVPVRHWTRRSLGGNDRRLWAGFHVLADGFRTFFCGDSGWFDGFRAIGRRLGPLDLAILPIGAYEPRWFMRDHHMNPEEAVLAYRALGGQGLCMGVHWGTFVLTDEPLDEPPARMAEAWRESGLPTGDLWIPRHGETRVLSPAAAELA